MKCIGTSKDTYGLGCRTEQEKRKLGLGINCGCYSKFLRETPQGKARVSRTTLKVTKPRKDLEQAKQEKKQRVKLPEALKQTQKVFNEFIRLRDKYKPCISSGAYWKSDHEAGHLFSVKQYSELRFDPDNCHSQSIGDNRFREGNFENYLICVEERIGKHRLNKLIKKAELSKQRVFKWDLDELLEIRKFYKEQIKELQKGQFS